MVVDQRPDPRRWKALAVVCAAFFMTVLDVSIVNVALPSIQRSLHFSQEDLQWIITAYAITFGGLLLLAGRAADVLGRKRVFMTGIVVFTIASFVCGLASSEGILIASRAVQGIGAAIITPSALSIVSTTFNEGAERNKALGIWGAVGGSGAAVGVLAGGILTRYLGWEWIFYVNVPVGIAAFALARPLVRESRASDLQRRADPAGAVAITAGLALLVYTISKAPDVGWATPRTIGLLVLSAALLIGFVLIERVATVPLVPLSIFRLRTLSAANVVGLLLGATLFSNFFLLTLYVQEVLGYSALKTGLTFLATAGTAVVVAGIAQALTTRRGPKPVMIIGMVLLAAGALVYTQIGTDTGFLAGLLPGYLLVGVGIPLAFIPISIAALAGVQPHQAGLASGLINTSQQIGGAIGVAVASTILTTRTTTLLQSGDAPRAALTGGVSLTFWVIAAIAAAGAVAAGVLVRREELVEQPQEAPAPAAV